MAGKGLWCQPLRRIPPIFLYLWLTGSRIWTVTGGVPHPPDL
jgi:hypothetical protein